MRLNYISYVGQMKEKEGKAEKEEKVARGMLS
jgi:hypothetical protein